MAIYVYTQTLHAQLGLPTRGLPNDQQPFREDYYGEWLMDVRCLWSKIGRSHYLR